MLKVVMGLAALATMQAAGGDLVAEMQQVESARNAAIRTGDRPALERLYAADFQGIAGSGARVDRATLFQVFQRNAGGDFVAESTILSAREANGLVLAEGRLRIWSSDRQRLLGDGHYLHIFRRNGDHWEMVSGAAVPIAAAPTR
jgi:hypothetical protein